MHIINRLKKKLHTFRCREIVNTPPIESIDCDVSVVSMVNHDDVISYLVAIKSFVRNSKLTCSITAINDGTLTASDKALLSKHIAAISIVDASSVFLGRCPSGGTWERLAYIVSNNSKYIIQIDSDTVTLCNLKEIHECIEKNVSFVISGGKGDSVDSVAKCAEVARTFDNPHVQILAESEMEKLDGADRLKYVRGCSGFSGFSANSVTFETLEMYSLQMSSLIGPRWSEWGTEQISSNFLIANTPHPHVLPYPKYANFRGEPNVEQVSNFVHFIGINRFTKGKYTTLSRTIIKQLMQPPDFAKERSGGLQ